MIYGKYDNSRQTEPVDADARTVDGCEPDKLKKYQVDQDLNLIGF
jgi:hypothetical protein